MSKSVVLLLSILFLFIGLNQADLIAADGKTVYGASCKSCHGPDGKGNEKVAKILKIDLSKLSLVKDETTKKSDAELVKTIHDGAGKMKPFKDKLKNEEIFAVVDFIRSLKK